MAYSKCGRTSDLYNDIHVNISVSRYVNVLKIMPKFLLAKLTFADMWSLKVNLLSIITPRSFSFATFLWLVGRYLSAWYKCILFLAARHVADDIFRREVFNRSIDLSICFQYSVNHLA